MEKILHHFIFTPSPHVIDRCIKKMYQHLEEHPVLVKLQVGGRILWNNFYAWGLMFVDNQKFVIFIGI